MSELNSPTPQLPLTPMMQDEIIDRTSQDAVR